ncbi:MAG: hypothetical protein KDA85_06570 [Planctomycetaceae bacterium]|nr:hypothetical protein [Planctomycetaceae bacterium]
MTQVIAICGSMGSGKTTVVTRLSELLPRCVALFEDEYNRTTERSLTEMRAWLERGADIGEFDLSALIIRLKEFTVHQHARSASAAAETVLLESQFGRLHPGLSPYVDFQCWLDVPADIAIVRKIRQLTTDQLQCSDVGAAAGLSWIADFCQGYLAETRPLLEMQRREVRHASDLRIDGMQTPELVCQQIIEELSMMHLPVLVG